MFKPFFKVHEALKAKSKLKNTGNMLFSDNMEQKYEPYGSTSIDHNGTFYASSNIMLPIFTVALNKT